VVMSAVSPIIDSAGTDLVTRRSSESASPRKWPFILSTLLTDDTLAGEISEASLPITRSVTKSPICQGDLYVARLVRL
jgi:hypothetical protein